MIEQIVTAIPSDKGENHLDAMALGGVMKVFGIDDGQAVVDLVAHFLGIATHHNVNAAPSAKAALKAVHRQEFLSSEFDQLAQNLSAVKSRESAAKSA